MLRLAGGFSSDPGPGRAAGLQGGGGSSLVKLAHFQSLDQTVSDEQGEGTPSLRYIMSYVSKSTL